jgi:hypothetical protein
MTPLFTLAITPGEEKTSCCQNSKRNKHSSEHWNQPSPFMLGIWVGCGISTISAGIDAAVGIPNPG